MKNNINIPINLNKKYLSTYLDISTDLYSNKENRIAIISESILNRPCKNSDLDIVVVTTNNYWQRKQLCINNIFVELFFYPKEEIAKLFKNKEYQDMHMIGYGYTIFDKDNDVKNLKKIAVDNFKAGPKKLKKEDQILKKYLIWDENQDILDILKTDKAGALSLMNKSILNSIDLFFALKNKWPCKPKFIISSVKNTDNYLGHLLKKFYLIDNNKLSQKYIIYKEIVSKIISPYDIDKPFVWVSKKEKIKK